MNFAEFQTRRRELLQQRPDVVDCAETNLYRALAHLLPPAGAPPTGTVHRCHLAQEWASLFGFPASVARRALVCGGVRDSLERLFRHYARVGARLWLPVDNYPVYHELASGAGLVAETFATLPEPRWPDASPGMQTEILLVTNPLKPLGRWLSEGDTEHLLRWLAACPCRRVWLDAVYTFDTRFHHSTIRLLATGQAVLLHSVTKGWLSPRLFGVALVTEDDVEELTPLFRDRAPSQASLARAREFLTTHRGWPAVVARELKRARRKLAQRLPEGLAEANGCDAPGYFVPVPGGWEEWLSRKNILGLPASIFGSPRADFTILSSLSFVHESS